MANRIIRDAKTAAQLMAMRTARGETQEQFAAHFRVGRTTILNWETCGPPLKGPVREYVFRRMRQLRSEAKLRKPRNKP